MRNFIPLWGAGESGGAAPRYGAYPRSGISPAPVGVPSGWDEVGALFCKCGDFTVLLVHARRVRSSAEWYCDTAYHDWTLSPEDVA